MYRYVHIHTHMCVSLSLYIYIYIYIKLQPAARRLGRSRALQTGRACKR